MLKQFFVVVHLIGLNMNTLQRRIIILFATAMLAVAALLSRYTELDSMTLVFYRMFFATLITIPILFFVKFKGILGNVDKKQLCLCAISGIIMALYFAAFFESLKFTSIASNLVFIDTSVFFIAGFMFIFYGEKVSRKAMLAIMVAFGGSILIGISDMGGGSNQLWGDILALLGAILFAVYTIVGRGLRSNVSTALYTFIVYAFSAITALILCFWTGSDVIHLTASDYLCTFGMALFSSILGNTIYSWGLKYETPVFISLTLLGEPVFGTVMALLLFSEIPTVLVILGSVLILVGIYYFSINNEGSEV